MRVELVHILSLPERQVLQRLAAAVEQNALALERIAAVVETGFRGDDQDALDVLTERLRKNNATLADEVARVLATTPQP